MTDNDLVLAISEEETAYALDVVNDPIHVPTRWERLDALRSLLAARHLLPHAGHAIVEGWYERDRATAIARAEKRLAALVESDRRREE